MDFVKFLSLLEKQALFFARADKLGDPFEGAWPTRNKEAQRKYIEDLPANPYGNHLLHAAHRDRKESPRFVLISCWHENHNESDAMWKLYSKEDCSIAIKTNFDSFKSSFTAVEEIFIGRVSYLNYETDKFTPNSWIAPFLSKRKSFEHEKEVRAIVDIPPTEDGKPGLGKRVVYPQNIIDVGRYCEVDLSLLVKEVLVSPYAPVWLLELTKSVASTYNLEAPVVRSTLYDNPNWD